MHAYLLYLLARSFVQQVYGANLWTQIINPNLKKKNVYITYICFTWDQVFANLDF